MKTVALSRSLILPLGNVPETVFEVALQDPLAAALEAAFQIAFQIAFQAALGVSVWFVWGPFLGSFVEEIESLDKQDWYSNATPAYKCCPRSYITLVTEQCYIPGKKR